MEEVLFDIKRMPLQNLWTLFLQMAKEARFYEMEWRELGRWFFSHFYGKEVLECDYETLLSFCRMDDWPFTDDGLQDEDFYKSIFKHFFWVETLPRDSKQRIFLKIQCELRILHGRLKRYTEEILSLERTDSRTGEQEYELRLLRHYLRKVQDAINSVCGFVANDLDADAFRMSQKNFSGNVGACKFNDVHDKVTKANRALCNDIANKFFDWEAEEVDKIRLMYNNDPISFCAFAEKALADRFVPETLKLIDSNHLLFARRNMLREGISQYQDKKYQVANSVLALQIEGLIRDVLVSCGCSEKKLRSSSLTEKAVLLEKQGVGFSWSEYYAFCFPVLRNKIAHGDAHETQREEATLVLLDLCALCRYIARDLALPCNRLVYLTRRFVELAATDEVKIDYARFVVAHKNIELPAFYDLQAASENIQKEIQCRAFWDKLLKQNVDNHRDVKGAIMEGKMIAKRFNAASQLGAFKKGCMAKLRQG